VLYTAMRAVHHHMQNEQKEEWMRLCERAANEQDSQKLLELVKQINQILDEKDKRLKKKAQAQKTD
jgi:hypothetical protein